MMFAPRLRHPLMQFNGASTTGMKDVHRVINAAIAYAKERRLGDQPCRER